MITTVADITKELAEGFRRLTTCLEVVDPTPDDVVTLRRLLDTADIICTQTIARLASNTDFQELGHRDIGTWFAAKTGSKQSEPHARCRQNDLFHTLPAVHDAVVAGHFPPAHLRCLTAAVTTRRRELAQRDESVFVTAAASLDATQFAQVIARWVSLADDQLSNPEHPGDHDNKPVQTRRLQLTQLLNGTWHINGQLDPLAGETVNAALASVMPKPSTEDQRNPAQRRADALTDLCRATLAHQDRASIGNERPNVNIVFHPADGSASTTGGWYLRNWELSQVICDATLTAVASTLTGTVFDVGTPTSTIPTRNRKAVVVRDRCCRYGNCTRQARWCEIHHIRERVHGGTHELDNLVLLCTYHHREVHRRGIKLTWQSHTLLATHPNGSTIHGPPHPNTWPALE